MKRLAFTAKCIFFGEFSYQPLKYRWWRQLVKGVIYFDRLEVLAIKFPLLFAVALFRIESSDPMFIEPA